MRIGQAAEKWGRLFERGNLKSPLSQARALASGIELYSQVPTRLRGLEGQLFDSLLLDQSPLFRKSRALYIAQGGIHIPALLSSPRTLSSLALLENRIEYSPLARELLWAASYPPRRRQPSYLLSLRPFVSSVFHEQNHRLLWPFLAEFLRPPSRKALRRYLDLAEALVIATDMALGDELGPGISRFLHLSGVTYDPGTSVREEIGKGRQYRNYLHAAAYATYLGLELHEESEIRGAIPALYPSLGSQLAERATRRASRLDRDFVLKTNLSWQDKHGAQAARALSRGKRKTGKLLELPEEPADNRVFYLVAESWFEKMGL